MTCFDRFEFELTCQRKIIILNHYLFMGRKKMMAGGKLNWKTFHLFCFLIITCCSGRGLEKYKLIKRVGLFYAPCPGPRLLDNTASCPRPVSPHFLPCWPISVVVVELKTLPCKNCAIKQCRIVMTIQTLDTRSRTRVLQICIEHRCRLKQNHGKCCKWLWIFWMVAVCWKCILNSTPRLLLWFKQGGAFVDKFVMF